MNARWMAWGLGLAWAIGSLPVAAQEVALAGVLGSKAVLVVDGGPPRTLKVGDSTPEGITLLSIGAGQAEVRVGGETRLIKVGQSAVRVKRSAPASVNLMADGQGHFIGDGLINDKPARFLVDTGASLVSIGRSDAVRMGIDPKRGTPMTAMTANGVARVWRVRLEKVQLGEVVLHNVDAAVQEVDMPVVLLGMSFLGRTELRHESDRLTISVRP